MKCAWLGLGLLLAASGCEVVGDVITLSDLAAGPDLEQRDAPVCASESQGGPTLCDNRAGWGAVATAACERRQMRLDTFALSDPCGADGYFHRIDYRCCPRAAAMCVVEVQGGATSCKAEIDWKTAAVQACATRQATLSNLSMTEACGAGLFRLVRYECCPAASVVK